MEGRGEYKSMVLLNDNGVEQIGAVLWVDRDRKYFVCTTSNIDPAPSIVRYRYRRDDSYTYKKRIEVGIPLVAQTYFDVCSKVDEHNRCRQDDLRLERKVETKQWDKRVNHTLLGIWIVDAWLLYRQVCGFKELSQHAFYCKLAEELVQN